MCNGHAAACDVPHPTEPGRLVCRCEHNTCGYNCEQCCVGFTQKAWKAATSESANECERTMRNAYLPMLSYDLSIIM